MAEKFAVSVLCDGSTRSGAAFLDICPRKIAMRKGGIAWGALWALMIVTVFIPIVHFFAVPILFLTGPFLGRLVFKMYNGKESLSIDPISCPKCDEIIGLSSDKKEYPINGVCLGCKTSFSATIAP